MDPQQELFSWLLVKLKKEGYAVFDGFLPPENTPYPFIYLADNHLNDIETKGYPFGRISQTIHFWLDDPRKRGTLSSMMLKAKSICRNLSSTNNFAWHVRNIEQRILADNTTKTPLMHGVLEIEFMFS